MKLPLDFLSHWTHSFNTFSQIMITVLVSDAKIFVI